jgi:hypothetical protein
LLEKLSSVARPGGAFSMMRGALANLQVQQPLIHRTGDDKVTVAANILVTLLRSARFHASGNMAASVDLTPGNLLVIGQSALASDGDSKDTQLYYIVRATI